MFVEGGGWVDFGFCGDFLVFDKLDVDGCYDIFVFDLEMGGECCIFCKVYDL